MGDIDSENKRAENRQKMKDIRAENEQKDSTDENLLISVDGAKIKFGSHTGIFKVLNDVPTTQGKLTGTTVEKQIPNFIFDDGFMLLSTTQWQDFGTAQAQDNYVLLKQSTLLATGKLPGNSPVETGKVEFVDSGQINIPESLDLKGAPLPEEEELDFDIKLELIEEDFVPLGIADFDDKKENDSIKFNLIIKGEGVNSWHLVISHKGNLLYEKFSGTSEIEEVIITGKSKEGSAKKEGEEQNQKLDKNRYWPAGEYEIKWSGFDKDGIYDSTIFTSEEGLTVSIVGQADFKQKNYTLIEPIKFVYKKVNWVDVKIDKTAKRIDTTLRVNLTDGGENGLKCKTYESAFEPAWSSEVCPWDKIPKETLERYKKDPIKTRTKTFEDLENLALDGLNYHWGRNQNHAVAKDVKINEEAYEVYVNGINTKNNAMDSVALIYNTNGNWMRSGNPGSATLNPISWVGNLVSREAVCYNVGYIKSFKKWRYREENTENIDFKFTSAHEVGHEILKSYGGTIYSYGHKGSVNTVTQTMKEQASAYPTNGEIDIMPYYSNEPPYSIFERYVVAEKEALSLIWLTKLKIQ